VLRSALKGPYERKYRYRWKEVRAFVDGLSDKADGVMKRIDGLTRKDGAR